LTVNLYSESTQRLNVVGEEVVNHGQGSSDLASQSMYGLWYPALYMTVERFQDMDNTGIYLHREVSMFILSSDVDSPVIQRSRYDHGIVSDSMYPVSCSAKEPDLIVKKGGAKMLCVALCPFMLRFCRFRYHKPVVQRHLLTMRFEPER